MDLLTWLDRILHCYIKLTSLYCKLQFVFSKLDFRKAAMRHGTARINEKTL